MEVMEFHNKNLEKAGWVRQEMSSSASRYSRMEATRNSRERAVRDGGEMRGLEKRVRREME